MNNLKRILLLSDALFLISGGLLGPIYALFVEKIGGDLLDGSVTFALYMLTAGFTVLALSFWEDKSRHKENFVIAGYGIAAIGSFGYLLVNTPAVLFIVQIILGFAAALKDLAYDALFSMSDKKHPVFAWGEWEAMDYIALGIAAIMGGMIAHLLGFTILLWSIFLLSALSFISSIALLKVRLKT